MRPASPAFLLYHSVRKLNCRAQLTTEIHIAPTERAPLVISKQAGHRCIIPLLRTASHIMTHTDSNDHIHPHLKLLQRRHPLLQASCCQCIMYLTFSYPPGIQFKHSPFFRIEKAVSNIVECPGARRLSFHTNDAADLGLSFIPHHRINQSNGPSLAKLDIHDEQRDNNQAEFYEVISHFILTSSHSH